MIRPPRPDELPLLPQIENEADRRYARVGLSFIVDMPPATLVSLEHARRRNRLWVATSPSGRPVGFALMKLRGDAAWLDQLSVLDLWQRLGLGMALIDCTAAQAARLGFGALFLSTYRDVAWNAPYYARRGFSEVPRGSWSWAVRRQIQQENSHGHPSWRRIVMRRAVLASSTLPP
jgi:GNAT superfamily N-acetyltransferase